jgi:AAHS family 3-hydroxyphenylpropionic acid transporter
MRDSASATRVVALCFIVAVLEGFDIQALGIAAPSIVPAFSLSSLQIGWLFAISNLGIVTGALTGGRAGDVWGRRAVLTLSVVTFAVGTVAVGLSQGYAAFFIARLLSGLGFGAALPNMMALAVEVSPPERRARSASAIFCGMPLGGGSVALLSQLLPPGSGWRALFLVGGVLPLVLASIMHRFLPETRGGVGHRADTLPVGEALFSDGRVSRTLLLWTIFLPTLLILYLLLNWLPILVTEKGFPKAIAPQASLVFNYASVVGALVMGALVDRVGPRLIVVPAYAVLASALSLLSVVNSFLSVLVCVSIIGFTLMGANYALYGVAASQYPKAGRGTGSGAAIGVGRLGSVVGPLLAGVLLSRGFVANDVIASLIPGAVLAGLAMLLLKNQSSD